jgi:DDE superfamily endonuclease/Helix-turn-helix of DDE superfamily endonuclease
MNYEKSRQNLRRFQSLTSLTISEFDELLLYFEANWLHFIERYNLDGTLRLRAYSPRNESQLPTVAHKLFFILLYEKNNTLQEFLAASFDLDTGMANKWIHILSPILEKSLAAYKAASKIQSADFKYDTTYLIDGIERTVQRDTYHQEDFYSGKKKTHTVKNLVITNLLGFIIWASPTAYGRIHDKTMSESIQITNNIILMADLGFKGWEPKSIKLLLPHKKPRNTKTEKRELTTDQKVENKLLSKIRVGIEHVFSSVKIMRILKDRNRNYKANYRDLIFKTACALHNFRRAKRIKIVQKQENIS